MTGSDSTRRMRLDGNPWAPAVPSVRNRTWFPMPTRSQQEYDAGEIGGGGNQIWSGAAICRDQPSVWYGWQDCAGTWRSTDSGAHWEKMADSEFPLVAHETLEVDPSDPDLLIAVGNNGFDANMTEFTGIYRSENGGVSWSLVKQVKTRLLSSGASGAFYQRLIAYDPTSIANGRAQRWYCVTHDFQMTHHHFRVYSSADAGLTWSLVRDIDPGEAAVDKAFKLAVDPSDGDLIYLATLDGCYRSTDGGGNMALFGINASCSSCDIGSDGSIYIVMADETNFGKVRRSTDGGTTFPLWKTDWAATHIWVDPLDPQRLSLTPHSSQDNDTLPIFSTDGGSTWTNPASQAIDPSPGLNRGIASSTRFDTNFAMAIPAPGVATHYLIPAAAQVYRSTDGGLTIAGSEEFFTGYQNVYDWGWAFDALNENRIWQMNVDRGPILTLNGGDWWEIRDGDGQISGWVGSSLIMGVGTPGRGGDCRPGTQQAVIALGPVTDDEMKIARTTDDGDNWARPLVNPGATEQAFQVNMTRPMYNRQDYDKGYAGIYSTADSFATLDAIDFGAHAAEDPFVYAQHLADCDIAYALSADGTEVYRTEDGGSTWGASAWYTPPVSVKFFGNVVTFHADPHDPDTIYCVGAGGNVLRYNGTAAEVIFNLDTHVSEKIAGQYIYARHVVVDPATPGVIYVGLHGWGIPQIYRSMDFGATWTCVAFNLPRMWVTGINIRPSDGTVIISGCAGNWALRRPGTASDQVGRNAANFWARLRRTIPPTVQ